MSDLDALIQQAYAAFNDRDIDRALALMTPEVSWPKASEGGRVIGKEAIREYWSRQWQEFDPSVEPLAVSKHGAGVLRVRVRQRVRSLAGDLLSDGEVIHLFTLKDGLISAMHLGDEVDPTAAPSAAFARLRPD